MFEDRNYYTRRRFLGGATVLATTLAGCSGSDDGSTGTTRSAGTTTEVKTDDQDADADRGDPEFSIVSIDAPEEVAIGELHDFSITVENSGGTDGIWATTMLAKEADSRWEELGVIELEVPAGDTATWTSDEIAMEYTTQLTFRLDEADEEFSIRYVSATLAFGEVFTSPGGMSFTVESVEFFDSYTWTGSSGNQYEEDAPAGKKWAKVYVTAENEGSEQEFTPLRSDVNIIVGNQQYDNEYLSGEDDEEYEDGEISPGIVREGWIAYEIPEDLSKDDLRVQWADGNFEGDWTVYWTASA